MGSGKDSSSSFPYSLSFPTVDGGIQGNEKGNPFSYTKGRGLGGLDPHSQGFLRPSFVGTEVVGRVEARSRPFIPKSISTQSLLPLGEFWLNQRTDQTYGLGRFDPSEGCLLPYIDPHI